MLTKICTDIWRDVFDWLSRKDRGRLSLKFNDLGDREFSNVCQKWLHEWTKNVCLENLLIDSDWYTESACLMSNQSQEDEVPFAEVEMPDNINDFDDIQISYVNTTVLNFLRRMQPLFRFRSSHLRVSFDEESLVATRTALTHLMHLFSGDGIEFLGLNCSFIQLLPTIRNNFQAQFLGIKTLSMPFHTTEIGDFVEQYLPWLSTRRADGQPRMLSMLNPSIMEVIDRVRQNFLETTSGPVSFFISVSTALSTSDTLGSTIQNAVTGEQLVVIEKPLVDENVDYLLIGRCPAEVDGQAWIEEMDKKLKEAVGNQKRTIAITYPSQMEEAHQQTDGNEIAENGEEEDADRQPGPSNQF